MKQDHEDTGSDPMPTDVQVPETTEQHPAYDDSGAKSALPKIIVGIMVIVLIGLITLIVRVETDSSHAPTKITEPPVATETESEATPTPDTPAPSDSATTHPSPSTPAPQPPTDPGPDPSVADVTLERGATFTFTVPTGATVTTDVRTLARLSEGADDVIPGLTPVAAIIPAGVTEYDATAENVAWIGSGPDCLAATHPMSTAMKTDSEVGDIYFLPDPNGNPVEWYTVPVNHGGQCAPMVVRQGMGYPTFVSDTIIGGQGRFD